ncbi:hypothetical protein E3983_08150 [Legionella israelensis]|uniref:Uncharacterized protein n=1 Tax=Legionella israelensis TaxID=454 RepID=A0AAX1EGV4_9GAMM|nr:hypothetical protein [Legionella israelensis]QBR84335.1 hypothetical protein E3983_08150 [Legionella israelensis]
MKRFLNGQKINDYNELGIYQALFNIDPTIDIPDINNEKEFSDWLSAIQTELNERLSEIIKEARNKYPPQIRKPFPPEEYINDPHFNPISIWIDPPQVRNPQYEEEYAEYARKLREYEQHVKDVNISRKQYLMEHEDYRKIRGLLGVIKHFENDSVLIPEWQNIRQSFHELAENSNTNRRGLRRLLTKIEQINDKEKSDEDKIIEFTSELLDEYKLILTTGGKGSLGFESNSRLAKEFRHFCQDHLFINLPRSIEKSTELNLHNVDAETNFYYMINEDREKKDFSNNYGIFYIKNSDQLRNINSYEYLRYIVEQNLDFFENPASFPRDLEKLFNQIYNECGEYNDSFSYGDLYTKFMSKIESFIRETTDKEELSKLDGIVECIYLNENHALERAHAMIGEELLINQTSDEFNEALKERMKKSGYKRNSITPVKREETLTRVWDTALAPSFKPQRTTSQPSVKHYQYKQELDLPIEIRMGTQAQRHIRDPIVSPLFKRYLEVQEQKYPASITHIYFNGLGYSNKGLTGKAKFERNIEKEMSSKLHELENEHPNVVVITLPADLGLMSIERLEKQFVPIEKEEFKDFIIKLASEDPSLSEELNDFHISPKARELIFEDNQEAILEELYDKTLHALGLENKTSFSSSEQQAILFHFSKYELKNYIIEKLNPISISDQCKDGIDRAAVQSLYYNLMKSILLENPLTKEEFERGMHAAAVLVKGRGMNNHTKRFWNAVNHLVHGEHAEYINNNCPWLIEWVENNQPDLSSSDSYEDIHEINVEEHWENVRDSFKELAENVPSKRNSAKRLLEQLDVIEKMDLSPEGKIYTFTEAILKEYRHILRSGGKGRLGLESNSIFASELHEFCIDHFDIRLPKSLSKGEKLSIDSPNIAKGEKFNLIARNPNPKILILDIDNCLKIDGQLNPAIIEHIQKENYDEIILFTQRSRIVQRPAISRAYHDETDYFPTTSSIVDELHQLTGKEIKVSTSMDHLYGKPTSYFSEYLNEFENAVLNDPLIAEGRVSEDILGTAQEELNFIKNRINEILAEDIAEEAKKQTLGEIIEPHLIERLFDEDEPLDLDTIQFEADNVHLIHPRGKVLQFRHLCEDIQERYRSNSCTVHYLDDNEDNIEEILDASDELPIVPLCARVDNESIIANEYGVGLILNDEYREDFLRDIHQHSGAIKQINIDIDHSLLSEDEKKKARSKLLDYQLHHLAEIVSSPNEDLCHEGAEEQAHKVLKGLFETFAYTKWDTGNGGVNIDIQDKNGFVTHQATVPKNIAKIMKMISNASLAESNGKNVSWVKLLHTVEKLGYKAADKISLGRTGMTKQTFAFFKEQYQNTVRHGHESEKDFLARYTHHAEETSRKELEKLTSTFFISRTGVEMLDHLTQNPLPNGQKFPDIFTESYGNNRKTEEEYCALDEQLIEARKTSNSMSEYRQKAENIHYANCTSLACFLCDALSAQDIEAKIFGIGGAHHFVIAKDGNSGWLVVADPWANTQFKIQMETPVDDLEDLSGTDRLRIAHQHFVETGLYPNYREGLDEQFAMDQYMSETTKDWLTKGYFEVARTERFFDFNENVQENSFSL